jgi:hypothetical protein
VLARANPIYQQPEILSLDEWQEMVPPMLQVTLITSFELMRVWCSCVKNKCGNDERNYQWNNLEELV